MPAYLSIAPDARLVRSARTLPSSASPPGGTRNVVYSFSRQSRARLLHLLATVRRDASTPLFLTLTYPSRYPSVWQASRDLRTLLKRLRRRWPDAGWVWRLEYQRRGAPHYHLLLWGVSLPDMLAWLPAAWYDVVGSNDYRHYLAGTQVARVRSWRGVVSYASKYLAKPTDASALFLPCCLGRGYRHWGWGGNLPLSDVVVVPIPDDVYFALRRMSRHIVGHASYYGWWYMSPSPSDVYRYACYLSDFP